MHIKYQKYILAINMYIEDPDERQGLKEKIYEHLVYKDPDSLYKLILGE